MRLLCFRLIASNGRRCKLPPDHAGACVGYYADLPPEAPEPSVPVSMPDSTGDDQKTVSSDRPSVTLAVLIENVRESQLAAVQADRRPGPKSLGQSD